MSLTMRWLGTDELSYGQACIDRLWRAGHVLARDPALFAWQFRTGPEPGTLGFLVAEEAGAAVGCIGMMALSCHRQGRPFPGAALTNFIVDPSYRAGGTGLEILRVAYAGLGLVSSIGINERVARLYRMLGQHTLIMPRYVCLAHRPAMATLLAHCDNPDGRDLDRYAVCSPLALPSAVPGHAVSPLTAADLQAWDRAWTELFAPRLHGVVKDAAYLRWRYLEHPVFRYDLLLVRDDRGAVRGLAVLREIPLPGEVSAVRVLDFLAADAAAGRTLAGAVARQVPPRAAFVEYICLGEAWRPLAEMGLSPDGADLFSVYFNPPDFRHHAIIGALHLDVPGATPTPFVSSPEMYMTIADGDQDRPN
jgi:hypothetical protein